MTIRHDVCRTTGTRLLMVSPQIRGDHGRVFAELRGGRVMRDLPPFDDVGDVSNLQRFARVLLDQQIGMPCALMSAMMRKISLAISGASPMLGSSSISNRGCIISARPVPKRCCGSNVSSFMPSVKFSPSFFLWRVHQLICLSNGFPASWVLRCLPHGHHKPRL